jgi:hypothetical protein
MKKYIILMLLLMVPSVIASNITVSWWAFPQSHGSVQRFVIDTHYYSTAGSRLGGFDFYYAPSGNDNALTQNFYFHNGSTIFHQNDAIGSDEVLQWHMITTVIDTHSSTATTYYNGTAVEFLNITGSFDPTLNRLDNEQHEAVTIGVQKASGGGYNIGNRYGGKLQAFYIFNRTLSQSEIDFLYNSGDGRILDDDGSLYDSLILKFDPHNLSFDNSSTPANNTVLTGDDTMISSDCHIIGRCTNETLQGTGYHVGWHVLDGNRGSDLYDAMNLTTPEIIPEAPAVEETGGLQQALNISLAGAVMVIVILYGLYLELRRKKR